MLSKRISTITFILIQFAIFSQIKIGNNPTVINSNSVLELESSSKGLLMPRVALISTSSSSPLSAHVAGMTVYNTATSGDVTPGYYYNNGSVWYKMATINDFTNIYNIDGTLTGNRIVTQGTNTLAFTSTVTNGFSVDGSTFSVDASLNRIGIGTNTPTSTLDVRGYGVFTNGSTGIGIGQAGYADLYAIGASNRLTLNYNRNIATDINFLSDSSVSIVAGGTGRLGVGKQFPTEKLDVYGNLRLSGALMPNNLPGTTGQVLTSSGAGSAPTWVNVSSLSANNIYNTNGTLTGNRTVTQGANSLAFTSTATNGFSVDGTTFSIDAANNRVGVLNATPTKTFDVANQIGIFSGRNGDATIKGLSSSSWTRIGNGGTSSGSGLAFWGNGNVEVNDSPGLFLDNSNRVGIGTSTPITTLDVRGYGYYGNSTTGLYIGQAGYSDIYASGSGNRLTLNYSKNVATDINFLSDSSVSIVAGGNGKLGIGKQFPSEKLDVFGNFRLSGAFMPNNLAGSSGQILISQGAGSPPIWNSVNSLTLNNIYNSNGTIGTNRIVTQGSNTLSFTATASNAFSVDGTTFSVDASSDRVGIGTTSPTSKLDVRGYGIFTDGSSGIAAGQAGYADIYAFGTNNRLTFNYGRDVGTDINFNSNSNVSIVTGGTGQLGIGTLTPDAKLTVSGTASKTGGGAWATFSDQRVKTDIQPFNDGLDVLMKLNPVSFKYNEKSGYSDLDKRFIGFIAQDVEKVTPYMVTSIDDSKGSSGLSDKRQFDESALTKIMVNAIKEQQSIIKSQQEQIDIMTKKINELAKIINEKK